MNIGTTESKFGLYDKILHNNHTVGPPTSYAPQEEVGRVAKGPRADMEPPPGATPGTAEAPANTTPRPSEADQPGPDPATPITPAERGEEEMEEVMEEVDPEMAPGPE